jgi:pimeloyl-ACP methyl ester carboxylesterase
MTTRAAKPASGEYTDKTVTLGSLKFHYMDWGNTRAQPMLLLHGGGQTAHSWDEFSRAMHDRYHVVALDQRGHGDSQWSPRRIYSLAAQVRDVTRFVEHLKLKNIILIGLSMGGRNAIAYAALHPEKLARLVIVDIGPETMARGGQNRQAFVQEDVQPSFEAFVERAHRFNPRRPIEQLRERLQWNLRQLPDGRWTWKYDLHGRGAHSPRARVDLWPHVARIKTPTLIVRGAESDTLAPDAAERLQAAIEGSRYTVVPNAGHTVPGDNPPGFLKAVEDFLAA